MKKKNALLLSSSLSYSRIAVIPFLLILAILNQKIIFIVCYLLAALTDMFDGWVARKYGVDSANGAMKDTIGDVGLYVSSLLFLLIFVDNIPISSVITVLIIIAGYIIINVVIRGRHKNYFTPHLFSTKLAVNLVVIAFIYVIIFGWNYYVPRVLTFVWFIAMLEFSISMMAFKELAKDRPTIIGAFKKKDLRKDFKLQTVYAVSLTLITFALATYFGLYF